MTFNINRQFRLFFFALAVLMASINSNAALDSPSAESRKNVVLTDVPVAGVTREMGYFPAHDNSDLAYVSYYPSAPGRYPTVVWFDVYGAGSLPPLPMVTYWVKQGYAFVGGSIRGTGCSQGTYTPFNNSGDAIDGAAFVDWTAKQSWSTGKVGLLGNSQPGSLLFGIAAQRPKHLVAIAPGGTVARTYAHAWYPGGIFNSTLAAIWSNFSQPGASGNGVNIRIALGDIACEKFTARAGPSSFPKTLEKNPFDGKYYRESSPWEHAPNIAVPTLMSQSWTDPVVSSSALWNFPRVAAKNKRLIVVNGGHEAYLYSTVHAEVLRWMDRWVKGEKNGVENLPRVRIDFENRIVGADASYGQLAEAVPGWTENFSDWPVPNTQWQTLYLGSDGSLAKKPVMGERKYFFPAGTEIPVSSEQFATPAPVWASLSYRGDPATEDTFIVGSPQLSFYAKSEKTDTDFMVVLHDVAANGDVTYLQRSYLRASHRAVDLSQSNAQLFYHPHSSEKALKAGVIYRIDLSINPIAHVLRKGHSIELLIVAPSPSPESGLQMLTLPGFNTVLQNSKYSSQLKLPTVPGRHAKNQKSTCGEFLYQPCRPAKRAM